MKTKPSTLIGLAALVAFSQHCFALEGLTIQAQGTNIVLSWPSQGTETYLVQHRAAFDSSSLWTTITNNYSAAPGTNRTSYLVTGVVPPPPPPGGGGGGGSPPPPPGSLSADGESLEAWVEKIRANLEYPPVPWDVGTWGSRGDKDLAGTVSPLDGPDSPEQAVTYGFYRVFHIPNFIGNVASFTFDGPTFLAVDFADYMDRVENIEVLLNGQPTRYAEFTSFEDQGQTFWGMGIYFDRIPSGTYQIQLRSTLLVNDEVGEGSVYLELSNQSAAILVDNQVTFTNWDDLITGTNHAFRAQTKTLNTDWEIEIYDAGGGYVNGASGHTSNGQIAWTWDLRDTTGAVRDSLEADPFFDPYITFAAAGQPTTRPTPIPMIQYPEIGRWVVAYQDKFYLDAGTNYSSGHTYFTNAMYGIAGGPAFRNVPVSMLPLKFGTNSYTQDERDLSWLTLRGTLFTRDNRNFYYYGHGAANSIGCDVHTFSTNGYVIGGRDLPGSKAFLDTKAVRDNITFNKSGGARPYRFVWLDGCKTALGSWPETFGMNKATNSLSYYTSSVTNPTHKRPSVFVGWAVSPGGQGWGTFQNGFNSRSQWMWDWYYYWQNRTLVDALEYGRSNSNWIPFNQFWGGIRVYGYVLMRLDEYNHKGDWRWP